MKSFQNFINLTEKTVGSSGRPSQSLDPQEQDIEDFKREKGKRKTRSSVEAARERLAATPVLTDDEMRAQNPSATAAYEKDVKERQARRSVTVDTPEGQITAGGASRSGKIPIQTSSGRTIYVTPDEAIVRAEAGLKPPVKNKPKKVTSTSKFSTQPTPAPAAVKPLSRLNLDKYRVQTFDPKSFKPVPAKASQITRTTAAAAAPTAMTAKDITKIVKDVAQSERQANAAEKAASSAKVAKAIGRVGTLGAVVSSGIEAKGEFDRARREGASRNRAFGAGVARALGGLGGSALGALGGGAVAGLPGAFIGGTAGYTGGANLASAAYKQITGDNKQKLTTQRVLTNIRKAVPQEIRREVPAGARKVFRDLVTQTGRTYGNWRRSQDK